ncbi:MAG: hypothetical protein Q8L10_02985 [Candidatus Moranbacteria bacterium]|nr:hypothetical protein [Candidatus Moranbacteria bacterium]
MKNLLEETLQCLDNNGKRPSDILWVGAVNRVFEGWGFPESICFEWVDFEALAAKYDYDGEEIFADDKLPQNLIIVGEDWWIERRYDYGCCGWVFKKYPQKPSKQIQPTSLNREDMNR